MGVRGKNRLPSRYVYPSLSVDQDFPLFVFHVSEFMVIYFVEFVRCYSPEVFLGDGGKPGRQTELTGDQPSFRNSDERGLMSSIPDMRSVLSKC